jgi:hypothetical protein
VTTENTKPRSEHVGFDVLGEVRYLTSNVLADDAGQEWMRHVRRFANTDKACH